MGGFAKAWDKYQQRGVSVVGVSIDDAEASVKLTKRLGLPFSLLHDPGVAVAQRYGVAMQGDELAIPAVFLVTQDGGIAWKHVGETKGDRPRNVEIFAQIDALETESPR